MVTAVLVAGSENGAAHRLGLSHSTVKHHLANARSKVGGGRNDGAACVDPGAAGAGAGWPSLTWRVAIWTRRREVLHYSLKMLFHTTTSSG